MPVDGLSPATVLFPLLYGILRAFRTGFELTSVPVETKSLLETISQVLNDIKTAKELRYQKAHLLDRNELSRVDEAIRGTETAMGGLESLVEHARVDMSTRHGSVGARSRFMWVMRDSNKVVATQGRLTIANQGLQTQIAFLNNRQQPVFTRSDSRRQNEVQPPPYSQATMDMLHEHRKSLSFSQRSATSSIRETPQTPPQHPSQPLSVEPDAVSGSIHNIAEFIEMKEGLIATASRPKSPRHTHVLDFAELTPQSYQPPAMDTIPEFEGAVLLNAVQPITPVPLLTAQRRSTQPLEESYIDRWSTPHTPNPTSVPRPRNQPPYPVTPSPSTSSQPGGPEGRPIPTSLRPGLSSYGLADSRPPETGFFVSGALPPTPRRIPPPVPPKRRLSHTQNRTNPFEDPSAIIIDSSQDIRQRQVSDPPQGSVTTATSSALTTRPQATEMTNHNHRLEDHYRPRPNSIATTSVSPLTAVVQGHQRPASTQIRNFSMPGNWTTGSTVGSPEIRALDAQENDNFAQSRSRGQNTSAASSRATGRRRPTSRLEWQATKYLRETEYEEMDRGYEQVMR